MGYSTRSIIKTIFLMLFLLNNQIKSQTYVLIPDTNLANYLQITIPTAMSGYSLNTSVASTVTTLNVYGKGIHSLEGIQYFTLLQDLNCENNKLNILPPLPNSIQILNCARNLLDSLPSLPNSLAVLKCDNNLLFHLPTLPNTLISLTCYYNSLVSLPTLPNSLFEIECSHNNLTSLPTLDSSLSILACQFNSLTVLPLLNNNLRKLYCSANLLTSIPTLNTKLQTLACTYNSLTNLPLLNDSLQMLYCENNSITSLPSLNNALTYLNCSNNSLSNIIISGGTLKYLYCHHNNLLNITSFGDSLFLLDCSYNSLTNLPAFPNCINTINCSHNNILCFPIFPNSIRPKLYDYGSHNYSYFLNINNNSFNCLPNYLTNSMTPSTLSYPLCISGNSNGCNASTTGINGDYFLNNIAVKSSPNPFTNYLTVNYILYDLNKINVEINLIEIASGKLISKQTSSKNEDTIKFDTENLSSGVYLVNVRNNGISLSNTKIINIK
jgi:Leucine-rich repeat (LRR) protein